MYCSKVKQRQMSSKGHPFSKTHTKAQLHTNDKEEVKVGDMDGNCV